MKLSTNPEFFGNPRLEYRYPTHQGCPAWVLRVFFDRNGNHPWVYKNGLVRLSGHRIKFPSVDEAVAWVNMHLTLGNDLIEEIKNASD